jgi:hypothetical protein
MNREFTRKELYDLVWSQPMRTIAQSIGISDVALAKHCKKANIPVPSRGYWARHQAGKKTFQVELLTRFPGASDRIGDSGPQYYYGSDWVSEYLKMPIPEEHVFEEALSSVETRTAELVGKVRHSTKFEPVHPMVARLLAHDDEAREQFKKYGHSFHKLKYESGIERRRLLILNTLFLALAGIACRASMGTSKYEDRDRDIHVSIGASTLTFNVEPMPSKNEKRETLRVAFGSARDRKERELQEELARERVGRLLAQAKSLRRANDIREYVDEALLRATEVQSSDAEAQEWAAWARREADRIDPVKNGSLTASILESKAS